MKIGDMFGREGNLPEGYADFYYLMEKQDLEIVHKKYIGGLHAL